MKPCSQTLADWLKAAGSPHHETRYAGHPHECVAIQMRGLDGARPNLFWLSDYRVSASVSGNYVELQPITADFDLSRSARYAWEALIAPTVAQARYFHRLARTWWAQANR